MAHIKLNRRQNREEGAQEMSGTQVIGLVGAATLVAAAGHEVGSRAAKAGCDKIAKWWKDDNNTTRDNRGGQQ